MQDPAQLGALFQNLAGNLAGQVMPKWRWGRSAKVALLAGIARGILGGVARREVHQTGAVLSADADAGLTRYLEDFLLAALREENDGTIPPELTFIFGHTHKPFEALRRFEGYAEEVQILNSGGWVVDTLHPDPLHGAAIIVVDDDLRAASIRLYNEEPDGRPRDVEVVSALTSNPLVEELPGRVQFQAPCWQNLRASALGAVAQHRENLRFKVAEA
jgi:hypothetical protein